MQRVQQRETPERISWARAMVFAVGFFLVAAILIGQLPSFVTSELTASSLGGLEQSSLALAAVGLAGFVVIQVIVMLFDPKPVLSPIIFSMLGLPLAIGGLALTIWASWSGNQFFPHNDTSWASLLGGKVLWFQAGAVDLVMVGLVILFVGAAMVFYSRLAMREQDNPDRSDLGTTPAIRGMIIAGATLLILFLGFYTFVDDKALAMKIDPTTGAAQTQAIIDTILNVILGLAIFLALGAFALRLHYLMRPVRKRTMSGLYAVGTLGLAQIGAIFLLVWVLVYPAIGWIHTWGFLGNYLTTCGKTATSPIPGSCTFTQQMGYIVDTVITGGFFTLFMLAIWAWKSHRNVVIVGSVAITAVVALTTILVHTTQDKIFVSLVLAGGMLTLATIWTSTARREFAVVGEENLGCLGQWFIVGTCLLIYLAAFALFSIPSYIPGFAQETEPNIPFVPGLSIGTGRPDAIIMVVLLGTLAAVQFFFLARNRYKV